MGPRMRLPGAERIRDICMAVRRRICSTINASRVCAVPRRAWLRNGGCVPREKSRHPVGASAARMISSTIRCSNLVPHARAPPPQPLSTACAPCAHRPPPPPRAWLCATPLCIVSSRCALTKSTPMVLMYESVKLSSYSKQSSAGQCIPSQCMRVSPVACSTLCPVLVDCPNQSAGVICSGRGCGVSACSYCKSQQQT